LPAGTRELRLRTNMEVYWDRLALAWPATPPDVRVRQLELQEARLAQTGFPRRTTGPQRLPHYDYAVRQPYWDTRYLEGYYTRFGGVEALVESTDDAVAIIGPGEEVHLAFEAPEQPPPPGWTRRYVLQAHGWAKDMDLFTREGETVGPLPTRGDSTAGASMERRQRLHERYHARFLGGR